MSYNSDNGKIQKNLKFLKRHFCNMSSMKV